jgi:hypothetical protein
MDKLMDAAFKHDLRRDNTDWQLRFSVYNAYLSRYVSGSPQDHYFELFASKFNRISHQGFTVEDDAFKYTWTGRDFYGNPPYTNTFIHKTLTKAVADHERAPDITSFVFVLPKWTTAAWYKLVDHFVIIKEWRFVCDENQSHTRRLFPHASPHNPMSRMLHFR